VQGKHPAILVPVTTSNASKAELRIPIKQDLLMAEASLQRLLSVLERCFAAAPPTARSTVCQPIMGFLDAKGSETTDGIFASLAFMEAIRSNWTTRGFQPDVARPPHGTPIEALVPLFERANPVSDLRALMTEVGGHFDRLGSLERSEWHGPWQEGLQALHRLVYEFPQQPRLDYTPGHVRFLLQLPKALYFERNRSENKFLWTSNGGLYAGWPQSRAQAQYDVKTIDICQDDRNPEKDVIALARASLVDGPKRLLASVEDLGRLPDRFLVSLGVA
jgi:hypothetical protein